MVSFQLLAYNDKYLTLKGHDVSTSPRPFSSASKI